MKHELAKVLNRENVAAYIEETIRHGKAGVLKRVVLVDSPVVEYPPRSGNMVEIRTWAASATLRLDYTMEDVHEAINWLTKEIISHCNVNQIDRDVAFLLWDVERYMVSPKTDPTKMMYFRFKVRGFVHG